MGAVLVLLAIFVFSLVVLTFFEDEKPPHPALEDIDGNHDFYLYIHNAWKFEDHFFELEKRKYYIAVDVIENEDNPYPAYYVCSRNLRIKVTKQELKSLCDGGANYVLDWYTMMQPDYKSFELKENKMYKMYF